MNLQPDFYPRRAFIRVILLLMIPPSMKFHPSNIYQNLSLAELIRINPTRFGILCANGSTGSIGTGGGGHRIGENYADYSSHHSFSFHLQPNDRVNFDYSEFLDSLKTQIAEEIVALGAEVTGEDNDLPISFALRYREPAAYGEVKIEVLFGEPTALRLEVYFMETSSREEPSEKTGPPTYAPSGIYYVTAFDEQEPARDFQKQWQLVREFGDAQLRRKMLSEDFSRADLRQTAVYQWRSPESLPEHMREHAAKDYADYPLPEKYRKFRQAYFFNETARDLFEEADIKLPVLEIISAGDVAGFGLRANLRYC